MSKITIGLVLALSATVSCAWAQENPPSSEKPPFGPSDQANRGPRRGVGGTITAINSDSLELKMMNGQSARVNVSGKTEYRNDRKPAKLADFKVGDMVFIRGQATADGVWQAEAVSARSGGVPHFESPREGLGKQFILGEIQSIQATQLTVLRPDGVSQTIRVDENTSFRKEGESITLGDFKVGDHVFGRGEMKNGWFTPTALNIGEPKFPRGREANAPR